MQRNQGSGGNQGQKRGLDQVRLRRFLSFVLLPFLCAASLGRSHVVLHVHSSRLVSVLREGLQLQHVSSGRRSPQWCSDVVHLPLSAFSKLPRL